MKEDIKFVNFTNGKFRDYNWNPVNMDFRTYKLINCYYQYIIEDDNWFWWKKLFTSKIINEYHQLKSVFLDKNRMVYWKWIYTYYDLDYNKSIKHNIKLILFLESNYHELYQINCDFLNKEHIKRFIRRDYDRVFKLKVGYVNEFNILGSIELLDSSFWNIYSKKSIESFINKYNRAYYKKEELINKEKNNLLKESVWVNVLEVKPNINNTFYLHDNELWFTFNWVDYEIYDWKILTLREINEIEKYKEDVLYK